MNQRWKALLKLKEIVSARHFAAGRLRGEVAASNKIPSEERMLYLLVYGKFTAVCATSTTRRGGGGTTG